MTAFRESILGTLVHRAVFMPFAKPKELRRPRSGGPLIIDPHWDNGVRDWSGEPVSDAIAAAVALLEDAIGESIDGYREETVWRAKLELSADAGGAWWSGPARDFRDLEPSDRDWVSRRLGPAAAKVAEWLSRTADEEDWKWIWSEVPLWIWSMPRPMVTRVDLLVGAGEGGARGYAFDLKVTKDDYHAGGFEPRVEHLDSLRRYRSGLEGTTFPGGGRASLSILYADREGKRDALAIEKRVSKW